MCNPEGLVLLADDTCWNCGTKGHKLTDCPHPKNNKQIDVNRKAYDAAKAKQGQGGGSGAKKEGETKGKWAAPAKGESRKKVIDDKPMYYNPRLKRWVDDKHANTAQTPPPTPAPAQTPAPAPAPNTGTRVQFAEGLEKFKDAMHSIASVLEQVGNQTN